MSPWPSLPSLLALAPLAAAQRAAELVPNPPRALVAQVDSGRHALEELLDEYCALFGWCWTADEDLLELLRESSPACAGWLPGTRVEPARVHAFVGGLLQALGFGLARAELGSQALLVLTAREPLDAAHYVGTPVLVEPEELLALARLPVLRCASLIDLPTQYAAESTGFVSRLTAGSQLEFDTPLGSSQLLVGRAACLAELCRLLPLVARASAPELAPLLRPESRGAVPELPASELACEALFPPRGVEAAWEVRGDLAPAAWLEELQALAPKLAPLAGEAEAAFRELHPFVRPGCTLRGEERSTLAETLLLVQRRVIDLERDEHGSVVRLLVRHWPEETRTSAPTVPPFVRADELDLWRGHPALRVRTIVRAPHLQREATQRWLGPLFRCGEWGDVSQARIASESSDIEISGPVSVVRALASWLARADADNARRGY